jgi:hypothetical protein
MAVDEGTYTNNYVCLTLGFSYSRIGLTVKCQEQSADQKQSTTKQSTFHYAAIITGKIDKNEIDRYDGGQEERIFVANEAEGTYTIVQDGKGTATEIDGTAVVTFDITSGSSVTLQGLPINVKVTIQEVDEQTWESWQALENDKEADAIVDYLETGSPVALSGYETVNSWTYEGQQLQEKDSTRCQIINNVAEYDGATYTIEGIGATPSTATFTNYLLPVQDVILTAYAEDFVPDNGETNTITLTDDTGVWRISDWKGSELYIRRVLTEAEDESDFGLEAIETVQENKRTEGSTYANSKFALSLKTGTDATDSTGQMGLSDKDGSTGLEGSPDKDDSTGQEVSSDKDVLSDKSVAVGTVSEDGLTITLYNANALTESTTAGTVELVLATTAEGSITDTNTEMIAIRVNINRVPAQINATVPLYVCMYGYGGDGKVVTPSDGSYSIVNNSSFPIQITSVGGDESGWYLKSSAQNLKAGELFLSLAGQVITAETTDTSGDSRWRIKAYDPSDTEHSGGNTLEIPVIAAIAGGSVNEDGESKVCTVTYKAAIPA